MGGIQWKWVATAVIATPCIFIAYCACLYVAMAIEDAVEDWQTRRAINRQKRGESL